MKRIIMITGGQRSGKSIYAEKLALSLTERPVYLATAHVWDEEFARRVAVHQQRRGDNWTNVEEEIHLSRHDFTGRVVLIDCITLWLTNLMAAPKPFDESWAMEEFDRLTAQNATFIVVTNEIGWGGTSPNALQRRFTDLQGTVNQHVASRADEVVMMVSGIAMRLKG